MKQIALQEIIAHSKINKTAIKKEHKRFYQFQKENPWFVLEELEKLKTETQNKNIPTFEQIIEFKPEFLLSELTNVYIQIRKNNPNLIHRGKPEGVYYYNIIPNLYQSQLSKGFNLGDKDDTGILVTGTNIVIEIAMIDLHQFLSLYYSINN